eukprot:10504189-Karenia_brevis.AAC.1
MTLLTRIRFSPAPLGTPGLTWLELFALSLAFAPPAAHAVHKKGTPQKSIGHRLAAFKAQVVKVIQLVLTDPCCILFKASRASGNRLHSLGFTNRLTHTSCLLHVHHDVIRA